MRNSKSKREIACVVPPHVHVCGEREEGAKNAARRIDAAAAVGVGNIIHKEGGCQFLSGEGGGRSMKIPEYRLKATDTHDGEGGALMARPRLRECRRRVARRL